MSIYELHIYPHVSINQAHMCSQELDLLKEGFSMLQTIEEKENCKEEMEWHLRTMQNFIRQEFLKTLDS